MPPRSISRIFPVLALATFTGMLGMTIIIPLIPEAQTPLLKEISYRLRDAYFFSKEINFATFRRKE